MRFRHSVSFWRFNPLACVLLLFATGILLVDHEIQSVAFLFPASLVLHLSLVYSKSKKGLSINKLNYTSVGNLIVSVLCISAGGLTFLLQQTVLKNQDTFHNICGMNTFRLKITSVSFPDSLGNIKGNAQITHFRNAKDWKSTKCKIRYKLNCAESIAPKISDIVYVRGALLFPFQSASNDFSYASWLHGEGYGGVLTVQKAWKIAGHEYTITSLSESLRTKFLQSIHQSHYSETQKYMSSALLLGDRRGVEQDVISDFSSSGIIHLLAVSGLHVGIIYSSLLWILASFKFNENKFKKAQLILIPVLWMYAAITGLSPSVCRAALMLSLGILASGFRWRKHSFNILFGAGLLLVSANAQLLMEAGFLLSFCAVAGILLSNDLMIRVSKINSYILRLAIGSAVISISAQLATFPVIAYLFGTFPSYFLLANLIAIPAASIVSISGFIGLFFSWIPYLGELATWISMTLIDFLIVWSDWLAHLPGSVLLIPRPDSVQIVLISMVVLVLLLNIRLNFYRCIKLMLTGILFMSLAAGAKSIMSHPKVPQVFAEVLVSDFSILLKLPNSDPNKGFNKISIRNNRILQFSLQKKLFVIRAFRRQELHAASKLDKCTWYCEVYLQKWQEGEISMSAQHNNQRNKRIGGFIICNGMYSLSI